MKNFKFKINNNDYNVEIDEIVENIAHIRVNDEKYEVELEKEQKKPVSTVRKPKPKVVQEAPKAQATTPSNENLKAINSPLPGNILDIKVNVGDKVTKGTIVMIMEAMKMENNIVCEDDGVVASIKVKVGQSVLQNDVLIEIG